MPSQRNWPPECIAVGIAVLLAGSFWPRVPLVAAMALVALGATGMTLVRYKRSPALLPLAVTQLTIYVGIYGVFIGAALHAANARSGPQLELLTILDVVASVVPMMLVWRTTWDALRSEPTCDA
jgi:hypothetical protein